MGVMNNNFDLPQSETYIMAEYQYASLKLGIRILKMVSSL